MHLHGWIGHVCLSLDSTTLAYHFLELDGPFWVQSWIYSLSWSRTRYTGLSILDGARMEAYMDTKTVVSWFFV